jgi:hypothetical protein
MAPATLTPLDFDPVFQSHASSIPNGRVYASVVVGSASPDGAPLGDESLDAFERLAEAVAPSATAARATPEVAWWRLPEERTADTFQLWLYPGPLAIAHWALDPAAAPTDVKVAIRIAALVGYWRHALEAMRAFFESLHVNRCAVAMTIGTYPAARPYPAGFDFAPFPSPVRSGAGDVPTPWRSQWVQTPVVDLADEALLVSALDQVLRHFSYRHTASTIDAVLAAPPETWDVANNGASVVGDPDIS